MDRLRQLTAYIAAQMSVLTVSQRLAIGLCAALIAGSLLWLLQWSTTPELVPLVTTELSYDDVTAAEQALNAGGVFYETVGTRILVRPADRHNALRIVHSANALPEGSLFDMQAVVSDQNPFLAPEARKFAQTYAKGNELAKVIATYPFVKSASVLIQDREKRRIGGSSHSPTASVVVRLAAGKEMGAGMIEGFAKLVAGAVAGLQPHNVNITDSSTGRSYSMPHPDDAMSVDYLDRVKKHEAHLLQKIRDKLADIPGLLASVTVELETSKRVTTKVKHASAQPKSESEQNSESSSGNQPTEPGVQANLGQALTAGGSSQTMTTGDTKTEYFEPKMSETETVEQIPFVMKHATAAVSIPRSFIVGVFTAQHPDQPGPKDDDASFVAVRDAQVARVKASVERIVMAKDPDDVEVDVYPDMEWSPDERRWISGDGGIAMATEEAGALDAFGLARTYGPQVGLLVLAMMSLFMMTRLVRRSAEITGRERARVLAETEPEELEGGILSVGPQAIGEAGLSDSLLTGKEVDGETLRYKELGSEVAKMVEGDPEAAAELIRRWVEDMG